MLSDAAQKVMADAAALAGSPRRMMVLAASAALGRRWIVGPRLGELGKSGSLAAVAAAPVNDLGIRDLGTPPRSLDTSSLPLSSLYYILFR